MAVFGHTCKRGKLPQTNYQFWQKKIEKNIERDNRNTNELEVKGWNVIIIWQCEIQNYSLQKERFDKLVVQILNR